jgi:hypothetical protein
MPDRISSYFAPTSTTSAVAAAAAAASVVDNVCVTAMLASGYPLENHKAVTSDGWVLNLYRIPHGKNRNTSPGKRPVIYLHHGISLSSACFTLLNENESMAYILADAGGACQPAILNQHMACACLRSQFGSTAETPSRCLICLGTLPE